MLLLFGNNGPPHSLGSGIQRPPIRLFSSAVLVQIILWYLDSGCSKLDLEEGMAPVRISSGPEPIMMFGQNSSSLVLHQMISNLVLNVTKALLASLQACSLKEDKVYAAVRLSLQKKRNRFVLDHSHQQVFIILSMLVQSLKGKPSLESTEVAMNPFSAFSLISLFRAFTTSAKWSFLSILGILGKYSNSRCKDWFIAFKSMSTGLLESADLRRKGLKCTPQTQLTIFESPPAETGHRLRGRVLFKFNVWVPIGKYNRVLERQKKLRNQISSALTASADVPSSVTRPMIHTSTLQPPRPPLLTSVHRDICRKIRSERTSEIFGLLHLCKVHRDIGLLSISREVDMLYHSRQLKKDGKSARAYVKQALGHLKMEMVMRIPVSKLRKLLISYSSYNVHKMAIDLLNDERLSLVDDLKNVMITIQHKSNLCEQAQLFIKRSYNNVLDCNMKNQETGSCKRLKSSVSRWTSLGEIVRYE
ncbi:hypothetical protein Tco_0842055 [Tanacetum coccineum]|uniref:Uncharacterized protein n=1 Tax=Tanacetum coccineum TaxID=301880 RepID=A0ABQ5B1Z5_9ASTR